MAAPTVLLDNGGWRLKAGWAGAGPNPSVQIPNCCARLKGIVNALVGKDVAAVLRTQQLHFLRPIDRGCVVDWGLEFDVWHQAFGPEQLNVAGASEAELWLTEMALQPRPLSEWGLEMAFEDFGFAAVAKAPAPVFAAYGRAGGDAVCVVDSGFSATMVVPCYGGQALRSGIRRVDVGGKLLTNHLKEQVSYRQYNMMDDFMLLNDVKEQCCYVAPDFRSELRATRHRGNGPAIQRSYVLPDFQARQRGFVLAPGTQPADETAQVLKVESERFAVPEVLFHPGDVGLAQGGVAEAVVAAISACPEPLREDLYGNVWVVGGNACLPGLGERLLAEVRSLAPADCAVHVAVAEDPMGAAYAGMELACHDGWSAPRVLREDYLEGGAAWAAESMDCW